MLRILIVENDRMFAKDLANTIKKYTMKLVGIAFDANEAIALLDTELPDLVLVDIELDEGTTGITVAKHIVKNHHIPFIFLTDFIGSSNKYYKEAVACNPSHYLPKGSFLPHQLSHFIETAMYNFAKQQEPVQDEPQGASCFIRNCFFARSNEDYTYTKIQVSDLIYLEVLKPYIKMVTKEGTQFITKRSLDKVLKEFNAANLIRIHQSFAVHLDNIKELDTIKEEILLSNQMYLPVGRTYLKKLKERIHFFM